MAALAEMERKIRRWRRRRRAWSPTPRPAAEKDKQALIEEGRKVAQDVQAQVKQGIELELQKAKSALATEASLLSLELAEGNIKAKISNQDHERIVKEYISKVGGRA